MSNFRNDCFRWEVYKSECVPIDVCGKGIQEQKVSCMVVSDQNSHEENKTLSIKDCKKAQIGKIPPPEIPCYAPCTSVRWVYSKWDEVRLHYVFPFPLIIETIQL